MTSCALALAFGPTFRSTELKEDIQVESVIVVYAIRDRIKDNSKGDVELKGIFFRDDLVSTCRRGSRI